ncbi:hypothetical protein HN018_22700 (plasmid) [Lichenicola cladoniae]|uniref:Uncharacterized protein n=1 Tax=Lichenicola cladoniae TaxID=1484109 RepID=A0A6M8HXV2_9PROT|nr:hypothetical protein [Lichenicola cladoniae]NPD70137.1 hypothetical protein [Acetobacteraceae bacterium]QKE93015.1 hypothetical protein HN018_22700 [Lichenicola cladoniae]
MTKLDPFADDAASISIGKLTIENGADQVTLYGSLDITRDQAGLTHARQMKALLDQIIEVLEAKPLSATVAADVIPKIVKNPFS